MFNYYLDEMVYISICKTLNAVMRSTYCFPTSLVFKISIQYNKYVHISQENEILTQFLNNNKSIPTIRPINQCWSFPNFSALIFFEFVHYEFYYQWLKYTDPAIMDLVCLARGQYILLNYVNFLFDVIHEQLVHWFSDKFF